MRELKHNIFFINLAEFSSAHKHSHKIKFAHIMYEKHNTFWLYEITLFRLHNSYSAFISKCMQYVQMKPMTTVPIAPTIYPEWLNAFGMANIPVPNDPFSKWINVSIFLYNEIWNYIIMKSKLKKKSTYVVGCETFRFLYGS